MWQTIGRLAPGLCLIGLACAVLLISDGRRRASASSAQRRIALFQISSRPLLDDTRQGAVEALAMAGFRDGESVALQRFNAEGVLPTADSMAKHIAGGGFDLVLTFSTPAFQIMASANREGKVIHVFGAVTDPFAAGVGISRENPLQHPPRLAGVGTFQPVKEVFRLARQAFPGLKSVGTVWCPAEACSEACVRLAREECQALGIELLEAQVDSSADVLEAALSLTQRGAQALWIGADNTVELATAMIIKAGRQSRIPVFTNTPTHANEGALLSLGADYMEVGRIQGQMAAKILNGLDPATIRIENVVPPCLTLNLTDLRKLRDPWVITAELRKRAAVVLGADDK